MEISPAIPSFLHILKLSTRYVENDTVAQFVINPRQTTFTLIPSLSVTSGDQTSIAPAAILSTETTKDPTLTIPTTVYLALILLIVIIEIGLVVRRAHTN